MSISSDFYDIQDEGDVDENVPVALRRVSMSLLDEADAMEADAREEEKEAEFSKNVSWKGRVDEEFIAHVALEIYRADNFQDAEEDRQKALIICGLN